MYWMVCDWCCGTKQKLSNRYFLSVTWSPRWQSAKFYINWLGNLEWCSRSSDNAIRGRSSVASRLSSFNETEPTSITFRFNVLGRLWRQRNFIGITHNTSYGILHRLFNLLRTLFVYNHRCKVWKHLISNKIWIFEINFDNISVLRLLNIWKTTVLVWFSE